jgi:hypothetical protein
MNAEPERMDGETAAAALRIAEQELAIREATSYPARSNWPSFVGHPCARHIFYRRTHQDQQTPPDARLSRIFALGRALETVAARRLEAALDGTGWTLCQLPEQMNRFTLEPNISGKVDRLLEPPRENGRRAAKPLIVEIKGISDHVMEQVDTLADMRARPEPWWQSYPAQIWSYELAGARNGWTACDGLFVLMGKLSGAIKCIPAPFDEDEWRTIEVKLEDVEARIELWPKASTAADREELMPARLEGQPAVCARCDFAGICHPPMSGGQGGGIVTEPRILEAMATALRLEPTAKEYDKARETVRAWVLEQGAGIEEPAVWIADGIGQARHLIGETTVYDVPKDVREKYRGKAMRHTVKLERAE